MCRAVSRAGLFMFLFALAARADDPRSPGDPPKTPAEQYQAINKEMAAAHERFFQEHRAAKTDEERQKVIDRNMDNNAAFARRMLAVAEKYPDDTTTLDPLLLAWGMLPVGPEKQRALDLLLAHYVTSDKLVRMGYHLVGLPGGDAAMRTLLDKNPHPAVRGNACFGLGREYKARADRGGPTAAADRREAEAFLERTVKEFADVKRYGWRTELRLGAAAENVLFELRHLSVGETAPDIAGEDVDGVKFKLSDYRGKVVLLDFWGHW